MISSIPPTASAIEQRARAMSKEYSLTSTPSKALSKISRVANEKENVSAAPADTRALPSKSTLEEYRKRLEQLRNARKLLTMGDRMEQEKELNTHLGTGQSDLLEQMTREQENAMEEMDEDLRERSAKLAKTR